MSRNVTFEELERLNTEVTNARYLLEELSPTMDESSNKPWGVLRLCSSNTHPVALRAGNIAIDWKDFFTHEESAGMTKLNKKKISPSIQKNVTYKDDSRNRKNGVNNVPRTETKEQIIKAADLNGLVTKLKGKVENKNTSKKKSRGQRITKIPYKW